MRNKKPIREWIDEELDAELERHARNERWSAWLIVAALVFEAGVLLVFETDIFCITNHTALKAVLFIIADLAIAVGVYGELRSGRRAKVAGDEVQRRSKERVSEANCKAEEATLALEELRAPRGLTLDQIGKLSEELKQFAGTQYVIGASFSSSELMRLKEHIGEALEWAEWIEVDCPSSVDIEAKTTGPGVGITAVLRPDEHKAYSIMPESNSLIDAGMALAVALSERGIETGSEVVLETLPPGENPMIYIMIGPKI